MQFRPSYISKEEVSKLKSLNITTSNSVMEFFHEKLA